MKYLLIQLLLTLWSVIFLYYFSTLSDFRPYYSDGSQNWYNIFIVILFFITFIQGIVSIIVFLVQKFTLCNWKEFPPAYPSLKWGIGSSLAITLILMLNLFHLLNLYWGIAVVAVIFIGFILLK
jgi:hypothetical protein